MIDTIFFLLVFFMITSLSMVQMSAKKVALPVSTTAQSKPLNKVVLTVDDKGQFYIDRGRIDNYKDVLPALQDRVSERPDRRRSSSTATRTSRWSSSSTPWTSPSAPTRLP